jgi:hypothetical protein
MASPLMLITFTLLATTRPLVNKPDDATRADLGDLQRLFIAAGRVLHGPEAR